MPQPAPSTARPRRWGDSRHASRDASRTPPGTPPEDHNAALVRPVGPRPLPPPAGSPPVTPPEDQSAALVGPVGPRPLPPPPGPPPVTALQDQNAAPVGPVGPQPLAPLAGSPPVTTPCTHSLLNHKGSPWPTQTLIRVWELNKIGADDVDRVFKMMDSTVFWEDKRGWYELWKRLNENRFCFEWAWSTSKTGRGVSLVCKTCGASCKASFGVWEDHVEARAKLLSFFNIQAKSEGEIAIR